MASPKYAQRSKFKTTKLSLDQLEARMLCAIDTALGHIQELAGVPEVGASQPSAPTVGTAPTVANKAALVGSANSIRQTANLSVLGRDNVAESTLTYTWSTTSVPSGGSVTYSVNGTNAAKNTRVTFNRAGNYDFRVTIRDQSGLSVTSNLRVTVRQVLTSIAVTPGTQSVATGATQQFRAQGRDQFNQAMSATPSFTWTTSTGRISSTGLFTAPTSSGNATITVRSGTISGRVTATVTSGSTPTPNPNPAPTPNPNPSPANNLQDSSIRTQVTSFLSDSSINRTEMIALLRSAGNNGSVDATELADLRYIVSNATSFGVADYVKVLAGNVVNTNTANARYQGATLGNLAAGGSQTQLNNLVDKWFMGTDLPTLTGTSLQYRSVAGSLFNGTPSTANMRQGELGDCYFIAALGALADENPDAVRNMFVDNGDGTFTVRFFFGTYAMAYNTDGSISTGFRSGTSATADYVTVNRSLATYASNGMLAYSGYGWSSSNAANSLWIALAEKAYAQWNETGRSGRTTAANTYASIEGGWMGHVNSQVLGYNATEYVLANSQQSHLTGALAANHAVTIGTKPGTTIGGLYGSHAYVVSAYNQTTNTFTLINPWGTGHPTPLSWAQLQAACDWFSVANPSNSTPIAQTVRAVNLRAEGDAAASTPVIVMVEVTLTPKSLSNASTIASTDVEDACYTTLGSEDSSFDLVAGDILDAVSIEADADELIDAMDAILAGEDLEEILNLPTFA